MAREGWQGLCNGRACESLQVVRKYLRLAYLRAEVVALAAQSSMAIRLPGSRRSSVPALGP
jgi:hypothetical protein